MSASITSCGRLFQQPTTLCWRSFILFLLCFWFCKLFCYSLSNCEDLLPVKRTLGSWYLLCWWAVYMFLLSRLSVFSFEEWWLSVAKVFLGNGNSCSESHVPVLLLFFALLVNVVSPVLVTSIRGYSVSGAGCWYWRDTTVPSADSSHGQCTYSIIPHPSPTFPLGCW